jgi:hypothetical protein
MKKINPFKVKTSNEKRFSSFRRDDIGEEIRELSQRLSYSSRTAPIAERLKVRKVIESLLRNAAILEGKSL